MKFKVILFLSLMSWAAQAQELSEREAINRDVWFNFMQAYQDLNASLFNQIHTDDVLRVSVDRDEILEGRAYKDANLSTFNRWNRQKVRQQIDFSFTSRVQKGGWAHEAGVYKLTRFKAGGNQVYFGKFNVTLKKVDGVWKIYLDSDTNEGQTVNEDDFLKGDILIY